MGLKGLLWKYVVYHVSCMLITTAFVSQPYRMELQADLHLKSQLDTVTVLKWYKHYLHDLCIIQQSLLLKWIGRTICQ